jgi:2-C-methyl-D-erythritol 4-phosphate cytidylyltransferase
MSPSSPAGSRPEVGVLLPAAGQGERAGAGELKQFRPIGGVPMLLRAVRPFAKHPRVRHIVIALPPAFAATPPAWLHQVMGQRLQVVAGGATRADSVANALARLDPACQTVLVHDAARPFVSDETIDAVIAAAQAGTGAVAAVPVGDTLKQVAGSPDSTRLTVRATVDRRDLWRAQTPQGFPRALKEAAYADWGSVADVTDDAQLVERAGGTVVLIPDHTTNIKVTTAQDFALAEALASR